MLVKPTVAQLLDKAENRFRLVIATAKRARQISTGSKPMTSEDDISPVTLAADEIENGNLKIYNEEEWQELNNAEEQHLEEDNLKENMEEEKE